MSGLPLFFVAIIPDDPVREEVTEFKKIARRNFQSKHALKSPAHITLKSPFRWNMKRIKLLNNTLSDIASRHEPFQIKLEGFDVFEPRVIFVDVVKNEMLDILQEDVELTLRDLDGWRDDRPIRPFHAHMTVAFKDLRKSRFEEAWSYYREIEYERKFDVDKLYLLNHRDHRWHIFKEFSLQQSQGQTGNEA